MPSRSRALAAALLVPTLSCSLTSPGTRGAEPAPSSALAAASGNASAAPPPPPVVPQPAAATSAAPDPARDGRSAKSATDEGAPGEMPPSIGAPSPSRAAPRPASEVRAALLAHLKQHLPPGGEVVDEAGAPVRIVHTTQAGDTLQSVAKAYLDFSWVYWTEDLAKRIAKDNPKIAWSSRVAAGARVTIPEPIDEAPRTADEERLGWPEDRALKGVFLHTVSDRFFYALEKMPPRGMNTIVLDAKDYDGWFTYPTKIALAAETEAAKPANIRDLARLVRFAHRKGVRLVIRVCCFHDPHTSKRAPRLSIRGKWGGPFPADWLDPANAEAQEYVAEIVKEVLDTGVDEVQLDYVRFIVQPGLKNAILPERGEPRVAIIRDFVRKIHALTAARRVPLSLDVFGVAAFNMPEDVGNLGQDLTVLAKECEAISPMVYPSHYAKGFHGWAEPGEHPEIVGIGTHAAVEQVKRAGPGGAFIRPWLQAMSYKQTNFGPKYVGDEAKSAIDNGALGWLLWNPAEGYDSSYNAFPARAH